MENIEDILLKQNKDRRLLSNVPDEQDIRKNKDRRGNKVLEDYKDDPMGFIISKNAGIRYEMQSDVKIICRTKKEKVIIEAKSKDISTTGILIELDNKDDLDIINNSDELLLKFNISPGSMPEGYEMKVNIKGKKVRDRKSVV